MLKCRINSIFSSESNSSSPTKIEMLSKWLNGLSFILLKTEQLGLYGCLMGSIYLVPSFLVAPNLIAHFFRFSLLPLPRGSRRRPKPQKKHFTQICWTRMLVQIKYFNVRRTILCNFFQVILEWIVISRNPWNFTTEYRKVSIFMVFFKFKNINLVWTCGSHLVQQL